MICHVKQSFEVSDNGQKWSARNGDIVVPPEWVVHNAFFKQLCDCGKITVHIDSKTIELEQAKEEAAKQDSKKGKK
jgi:hypothetical protein